MPQFTPGQREEALKWYEDNCPEVLQVLTLGSAHGYSIEDIFVDVYFKLKKVPFSFRPNQFIIGVEYKNEYLVKQGKESPNIRVDNPHPLVGHNYTHNHFALTVLMNLLKQLQ